MLMLGGALLLMSAGAAQDYTGNVDPSAYSRPMVMDSAINARARRRTGVPRQKLSPKAEAVCARLPQTRARLGVDDARVREIARLCRQAGR